MSLANKFLGSSGEQAAASFLIKKGYKILQRNFKIRYGEIDIIALDSKKETLVFVEVKTRSSNTFGTPQEAIGYYKLRSLIKSAEFYKLTHKNLPDLLRIDAISVIFAHNEEPVIEHLENISGF